MLLYIVFEVFEVQWQKATTLYTMLQKMYKYYNKSIFLFFIMHPTLYFSIWLTMYSHYNIYAMVLLFLKTIDILTKLYFIKKLFLEKNISEELEDVLSVKLDRYMPYVGLLIYPPLVYMAIY